MAPKTSQPTPSATKPTADEALTPARFERELQYLAAKAKRSTWQTKAAKQASLLIRSGFVLFLLGVSANVSQLNLSPVYGSIPAAAYHLQITIFACFVGWAGNIFMWRTWPVPPPVLLPVLAAWFPAIHYFLSASTTVTSALTAGWGPLVTELLTLFPLATVSAACVATFLDDVDLSILPKSVADAAPGIGSWATFRLAQTASAAYLQKYVGRTFFHTRVALQVLLAGFYAVLAPSRLMVFAIPSLIHTAIFNTHIMLPSATSALQASLATDNYVLLDRQESLTGYISVLESVDQGFRVMRCDHSLLGGEWVKYQSPNGLAEPIYAVFTMLEAIRLVNVPEYVPDIQASALVIGLGIGTTPSALVAHGIHTTTVEIDPVVQGFATKYFHLPQNLTSVVADAVRYTAGLLKLPDKRFDYIVHDVFTGGAEPIELFTFEFLEGLKALLSPNGVIAINYAGDFLHPPAKIVVRTIREVFPTCRMFRDLPRNPEAVEKEGRDFSNMVIFCKQTAGPLGFREPVEQDFLGSRSRQTYMMPKHEIVDSEFLAEGFDDVILRKNSTADMAKWQKQSALGHWKVMRTVLPPSVWGKW